MTIRTKTTGSPDGAKAFVPIPKYAGALYAGYRLGTSYHGEGKLPGSSLTDLSGNDRHLTIAGVGLGAQSLASNGSTNFATLPFSARDLAQPTGGMTLVAIATSLPNLNTPLIGNLYSTANDRGDSAQMVMMNTSSGGVLQAFNHPGGLSDSKLVSEVARDVTLFEMVAAVFRREGVMLYRRRANMAVAEIAWRDFGNADVIFGSADALLLGRTADGALYTGGGYIAGADLCSAALSIDQLDAAYLENKALMAAIGGPAI